MRIAAAFAIGLGGLVLAVLAFRVLFGGGETQWRQRLTVTVETADGVVSGSAVTEVTKTDTDGLLALPEMRGVQSALRGEAVVVDLGRGRYLFALLSGLDDLVYTVYGTTGSYEGNMARVMAQPVDVAAWVRSEAWPLLVTFDDIADPTSVRRVDPDDPAATLGPGVRRVEVSFALAQDAVTEGRVAGVLPCLATAKSCVPLNEALPYGDPMRNIRNSDFILQNRAPQ